MSPPFAKPRFGTDGLRGRFGEPPMDDETLGRVAAALGIWLQGHGDEPKRVLLGNDGRASAEPIARILAAGLAAAEVASVDTGLLTTPALAYLTRTEPVTAGIMISASHNPAADNGIKIFTHAGTKLADAAEREIEELTLRAEFGDRQGRSRPRRELVARYEDHLRRSFPELDLTGMRIAVDAAHGGGSRILPHFLGMLGAQVVAIGCTPDGRNINAGFGALHPERLAATVVAERCDFGICLDGDGDRGIFVDERGTIRDGDEVLAVMGPHLHARGELPHRTVVATVMSNLALRRRLADAGLTLVTTQVGDRHVVRAMREHGYFLGGEQSGHVVFGGAGHLTGDGLFTALHLLSIPAARRDGFAALFGEFHRYPQLLLNVPVRTKPPLERLEAVQAAVRDVEEQLGDDGRVVLRYSGTEDLCRVMVEGPDSAAVAAHAEHIAAAVRNNT